MGNMEYVLAGTVIGAGYLLSSNNKEDIVNNKKNNIEAEPTQSDIYSSNYHKKSKLIESDLANKRYSMAKNPIDSNIIPPQFNNRIINDQNNAIKYLQYPSKNNSNKNIHISTLSGKPIDIKEFTHNNMSPFFGSSVKQNTYEFANQPLLELYTGTSNLSMEKNAIKPMFSSCKNNI